MQGLSEAQRRLQVVLHRRYRSAKRVAVVATLEPGVGLLLVKDEPSPARTAAARRRTVAGVRQGWDWVVPLLRGRSAVAVAVDAPGGQAVGFDVTVTSTTGGSAAVEDWQLRTGTAATAHEWVNLLRPWLVSWAALVRSGSLPSGVAPGAAAAAAPTVPAAAASPSLLPRPPVDSVAAAAAAAQSALSVTSASVGVIAEGLRALGHAVDHSEMVRVGEAIPVAGPFFVCLATAAAAVERLEAERAATSEGLDQAHKEAEMCLAALLASDRLKGVTDLVSNRLGGLLSALEADVLELVRYSAISTWRAVLLGGGALASPSVVRDRMATLRGELHTVMQLATMEHLAADSAPLRAAPGSVGTNEVADNGGNTSVVDVFSEAVARGDVVAQVNLGVCYLKGIGVGRDEVRAVGIFQQAADAGSTVAKRLLGVAYSDGVGVAKDEVRAAQLFATAAEEGDPAASFFLGHRRWYGLGVPQDKALALQHFTVAADAGIPAAMQNLAAAYLNGEGVDRDPMRAMALLEEAAAAGALSSLYQLGYHYWSGDAGVDRDQARGVALLEEAAAKGHLRAKYRLGVAYFHGDGVALDRMRGVALIRDAAAAGDEYAAFSLSEIQGATGRTG